MSRARIAVLLVVVGAIAGALVAYVGGGTHRAVATLAVQRGGAPAVVPSIVALAQTAVLAENVAESTHVPSATVERRLHARALPSTALIELTYDDPSATHAAQLVQQAAATLSSLVVSRFPALRVAVVDPAHPQSGTRRPVTRDVLIGALAGLLLGAGLLYRPQRAPKKVSDTKVSDTARGFARRRLPERKPRTPKAAPEPAPEPVPEPVPEPEPPPPPPPKPAPPSPLAPLRAGLAAHRSEFPADQVAEWEAYLDAFDAQVVDGVLPLSLAGLAGDIFEPLQDRLDQSPA
ncbi:MAG TPA: hypothetical protein VF379_04080 [Gaiellaceae bacterium]